MRQKPHRIQREDQGVAAEVGEALKHGDCFAEQVRILAIIGEVAVVAEVADFEDEGVDAARFAGPSARSVIQRHRLRRHPEVIDGIGGEGLPF